jgi:murein DD-endopeptidase MepM/ murein hydrolase activator NlpD
MNLIIYSRRRGDARQIGLLRPGPIAAFSLGLSIIFAAGYLSGQFGRDVEDPAAVDALRARVQAQQEEIATTERQAQEKVEALTARIGQLNAHILRLDALGRRLVSMADLNDGEFNFDEPPARGGPDSDDATLSSEPPEVSEMLNDLALQIEDRSDQLAVLEQLLTSRRVSEEQRPEGRPVSSGWLSSYFGKRTDPFTGKQSFHGGIDFAGNEGSDVLAVAAGVVTWSGKRHGYGTMVEISHGNGLVTRYAHNKVNLVEVGETVKKGQTIAKMGHSGRATGTHVHFEVLKDDRKVNPLKYVQR